MLDCCAMLHVAQSALQGAAGSWIRLDETSAPVPVLMTVSFSTESPLPLKCSTTSWCSPAVNVGLGLLLRVSFPWNACRTHPLHGSVSRHCVQRQLLLSVKRGRCAAAAACQLG